MALIIVKSRQFIILQCNKRVKKDYVPERIQNTVDLVPFDVLRFCPCQGVVPSPCISDVIKKLGKTGLPTRAYKTPST